jgi:hypothetical protein
MTDRYNQAALSGVASGLRTRYQELGLGHHRSDGGFQPVDVVAADDLDAIFIEDDAPPTPGRRNQEAVRKSQDE